MPQIEGTVVARRQPPVSIQPSAAVELEWALGSAGREDFRADHAVLDRVYRSHPDLMERVVSYWSPDEAMSCFGFFELLILAHSGGLLFTADADLLVDRLDELCRRDVFQIDTYPLLAETEEDAAAIRDRLVVLRESPERRGAYVALVADLWGALRDDWAMLGLPAVEAAVDARRELVTRGADWREASRGECDFGPLLEETVAAMGAGGEVVVVPAFFTHRGLFVDLPGVVVIGVRADTTGAEARARTESLARRLKAISDPTRLAMVDTLRRGPRTVTELATAFSLAQPTVSNHVKVLREAGLVADERAGSRRTLTVQHPAVEELLATLQGVLIGHDADTPGPIPG